MEGLGSLPGDKRRELLIEMTTGRKRVSLNLYEYEYKLLMEGLGSLPSDKRRELLIRRLTIAWWGTKR